MNYDQQCDVENEGQRAMIHVTPKPTKCDHQWSEEDGQTDLYGSCTKCGMSFQRYIHSECA